MHLLKCSSKGMKSWFQGLFIDLKSKTKKNSRSASLTNRNVHFHNGKGNFSFWLLSQHYLAFSCLFILRTMLVLHYFWPLYYFLWEFSITPEFCSLTVHLEAAAYGTKWSKYADKLLSVSFIAVNGQDQPNLNRLYGKVWILYRCPIWLDIKIYQ